MRNFCVAHAEDYGIHTEIREFPQEFLGKKEEFLRKSEEILTPSHFSKSFRRVDTY
jgi:hypothetical protein